MRLSLDRQAEILSNTGLKVETLTSNLPAQAEYRVTDTDGDVYHVWLNGSTFTDVEVDGHRISGQFGAAGLERGLVAAINHILDIVDPQNEREYGREE